MIDQVKKETNPTLDIVPLIEAEKCIAAYKQTLYDKHIAHDNILKAYLLKTRDIFEALGIDDSEVLQLSHPYVRIYIGMEPNSALFNYKLFLVPVTLEGLDDITKGFINEGDEYEREYVYDFNTPCPRTCDRDSALYKAGMVVS
jgi:hypothetical protein